MRYPVMCLACLLIVTMWLEGGVSKSLVDSGTTCCYEFQTKKFSYSHIKSYELTSSSCSYKAVKFTLRRKGKIICARFEEKWVQDYLNKKKNSIKSHI
ncbi:C-C motif chemokine 13-like [Gracilinanus agilis]|uniref:C-C motif chemokine 13-like n=1 Tax=Gracilinanus agilis TaxID=191870 RepID=UPI001CFD23A9|nr:C-C motif chemokine 13-like [Gracilinanus agilis]